MSMQIERTVASRISKFDDVEVHVSKVVAQGQTYVEIREFVPSLGQYGKGVTLPMSLLDTLSSGLEMVSALVYQGVGDER